MMRHYHYGKRELETLNKRWSGAMIGAAAIAASIGGGVAMYEGSQNRSAAQRAQDEARGLQFKSDPYYGQTQSKLFPFYSSLMEGNIPDYYKDIGLSGGTEYTRMLDSLTKNTTKSANESLARRGMSRSGMAGASVADAVSNSTASLGWQDYLRAMEGRKWLGTWGTTGMEGVRSSALTNQAQMNNFDLSKMGLGFQGMEIDNNQQASEDDMWGQLVGSGISAAGNIYGMNKYTDAATQAASFANAGDYGIESMMRGSAGAQGGGWANILKQLQSDGGL